MLWEIRRSWGHAWVEQGREDTYPAWRKPPLFRQPVDVVRKSRAKL